MKQQLKENVQLEITAIKGGIAKLKKAIMAESNEEILAIRHRELQQAEQQLAQLIEELDAITNKTRNTAKDEPHNHRLLLTASNPLPQRFNSQRNQEPKAPS